MEYRANFTSKTCERRLLNDTFRPFSIPYTARYIDTIEIGSNFAPGDGVEAYIWGGQTTGKNLGNEEALHNVTDAIIFFYRRRFLHGDVDCQRLYPHQ